MARSIGTVPIPAVFSNSIGSTSHAACGPSFASRSSRFGSILRLMQLSLPAPRGTRAPGYRPILPRSIPNCTGWASAQRRGLVRGRTRRRAVRHCARRGVFRRVDVLPRTRRFQGRAGGVDGTSAITRLRSSGYAVEHAAPRAIGGDGDSAGRIPAAARSGAATGLLVYVIGGPTRARSAAAN